jgi:hypothetical protein
MITSPVTVVITFIVCFFASILWATRSHVSVEHPHHGEASPQPGKRS